MAWLVTIDEAGAQWERLIARVEAGKEILIARNGAQVARLTRFQSLLETENLEPAIEPFERKP